MDGPTGEQDSNSNQASRALRLLRAAEDGVLVVALFGIMLTPIVEMVLRTAFKTGLAGSNSLTQHLTLLVSLVGGSVAARQARLLTISQGFAWLKKPWGAICEVLRAGFSAGIALLLAWGALEFVFSEAGVYMLPEAFGDKLTALKQLVIHDVFTGQSVAFGIPVRLFQFIMVLGFLAVGVRLLLHPARSWLVRAGAAAVALALCFYILRVMPESMTPAYILLAVLLVTAVLGAPIFALLGGAAVFLFWGSYNPLATIALSHYSLSTNPTIPALPLFTLAGYFLAEGGTSERMIRLIRATVGNLRSGPAIVTVCACGFFTSLTGASGVTILALGGLLVPFLTGARYTERDAIGLVTGTGSVGMLFAPCLPLILYAIIAQVEIRAMFLGGVGPGMLLALICVVWATLKRPAGEARTGWGFNGAEALRALNAAKWELLIPVVSLGGIFSGLATPVEAAAITALYALVIETAVYRDFNFKAIPRVVRECGLLIGGVLLILGVAQAFTNYLVDAQVPSQLVDFVTANVSSKLVFLALLTIVLLLVGCMMDVFSAIIVVVPLIVPLGDAFGIDPVHLGILFLANLGLGFLTPPVGMNLFLASYRFGRPMSEVLRAALPYFWLQLVAVLLISYWPTLTLTIPRWFGF